MANPNVSWVRERGKNWLKHALGRAATQWPGVFGWFDPDNAQQNAACEKFGANMSILFAAFLERAVTALPDPAARADNVLQAIADMLREDAEWWDPEPEGTIPE